MKISPVWRSAWPPALLGLCAYCTYIESGRLSWPSNRIPFSTLWIVAALLVASLILSSQAPRELPPEDVSSPCESYPRIFLLAALQIALYFAYRWLDFDQRLAAILWAITNIALCVWMSVRHRLNRAFWRRAGISGLDVALLFVLFATSTAYMASSLHSSSYFLIPDESAFFFHATRILDGVETKVLWGLGAFSEHPTASSLYTSAFLLAFGEDITGFRLASVVACTFTIFPLYGAARIWMGRGSAWFCAISYAFTYFVQSFGHTGYNNVQVMPVLGLTLCFSSIALRTGNLGALWLSGASAAMGLYANYLGFAFALLPLLVPAIGYLSSKHAFTDSLRRAAFVALAYVAVGLPMLSNLDAHLNRALVKHASGLPREDYKENGPLAALQKVVTRWKIAQTNVFAESVLSPICYVGSSHFTGRKAFDGLSGALFALGILVGTVSIFRGRLEEGFLPLTLLYLCFVVAVTSKYSHLAPTRVVAYVPVVALCAARGLWSVTAMYSKRAEISIGIAAGLLSAALNMGEIGIRDKYFEGRTAYVMQAVNREIENGKEILMISRRDLAAEVSMLDKLYRWEGRARSIRVSNHSIEDLMDITRRLQPDRIYVERDLIRELAGTGDTAEMRFNEEYQELGSVYEWRILQRRRS